MAAAGVEKAPKDTGRLGLQVEKMRIKCVFFEKEKVEKLGKKTMM